MAINFFSERLSKMWDKMDSKILNSKINKSIEILQNSDTKELEKQISKINPDELLEKIDEFDQSKLDELDIDKNQLKEKISTIDLKKVSSLLGEKGDEIISKLQDFLT